MLLALEEATEKGIIDEAEVTQERLERFLSRSGRNFYKLAEPKDKALVLERKGETIPVSIKGAEGSLEIGNSRPDASIFSLQWAS